MILQFAQGKNLDITVLYHATAVFMVTVTTHMDASVTMDGAGLTAV